MYDLTLRTAIALRTRGFGVHWLWHKSKAPIAEKWSTIPVMSVDDLKASYRTGYGLGVRLGEWSMLEDDCALVALDIDIKGGEDYACDPYETLYRYGDIPIGLEVQSGSGLGRHIWLRCPRDTLPRKANSTLAKSREVITLPDGSIKQAWMIELLSTGKQLVAPPSLHPSTGQAYRWLTDLDAQPQRIPDSILNAIADEAPQTPTGRASLELPPLLAPVDSPALEWAIQRLQAATHGTKHDTRLQVSRLVGGLIAGGQLDASAAQTLTDWATAYSDDPKQAARDVSDGLKYGEAAPLYPERKDPLAIRRSPTLNAYKLKPWRRTRG